MPGSSKMWVEDAGADGSNQESEQGEEGSDGGEGLEDFDRALEVKQQVVDAEAEQEGEGEVETDHQAGLKAEKIKDGNPERVGPRACSD